MSQASHSKEPSMDEILASIRRIIESSDEKPGASLASNAARIAASDRAALARDDASGRPSSIALPVQAARVVPFSDQAPATTPPHTAKDDSNERWVPLAEPANSAGEAPMAGPADADALQVEPAATLEPVASSDRWARELDDAGSWAVLDRPDEVRASDVRSEAPASSDVALPSRIEETSEPQSNSTDRTGQDSIQRDAEPVATAAEPAAPPEVEDDFIVDFDEADFVEALDRNAALVTSKDATADAASAAPAAPAAEAPQPHSPPHFVTESGQPSLPAFFGARASLVAASTEPLSATPEPSVVQQASVLMSEQAGSQVAAAFDDLARAIRDGQMTSMEDMSRELLRPMLQEWLDDNLPRLVERLVREEIERVSRGTRR